MKYCNSILEIIFDAVTNFFRVQQCGELNPELERQSEEILQTPIENDAGKTEEESKRKCREAVLDWFNSQLKPGLYWLHESNSH